jgi:hypothetical protein
VGFVVWRGFFTFDIVVNACFVLGFFVVAVLLEVKTRDLSFPWRWDYRTTEQRGL